MLENIVLVSEAEFQKVLFDEKDQPSEQTTTETPKVDTWVKDGQIDQNKEDI